MPGEGEKGSQVVSSVQSLSCVQLFTTPWTVAHQASLSINNSQSLLKLMSNELVMPNNLILCRPLLLPSIFPSIRVFSNESVLRIRWQRTGSFSFSISLSNEYSGLISLGSIGLTGGQFPLNQPTRREKEILAWFWKPRPLATMPSPSMSSEEQFLLWGQLNLFLPPAGMKKVKVAQSCLESLRPHGLDSPWNSPDQDTGVSSLSLLQGIFLTQGSNPGLLHCRQILY